AINRVCKPEDVKELLTVLCTQLTNLEEEGLAVFGTLISFTASAGAIMSIPTAGAIVSVPALLALQQSFIGVLTSLSRLLCELMRSPGCLTGACLQVVLCSISETIVFL